MPKPGEHKTVQARIIRYAQEIGWTYVPRPAAEQRRGFDAAAATPDFRVPNHGKLWKSLMRAHLGEYEVLAAKLKAFE